MEGQMTIWDYLKSNETEEPDDHVCIGCKWRSHENRRLEVEDGQTWVYQCPGAACANWRHGTPLNLSGSFGIPGEEDEGMYCYNRDFLPDMEHLIPILAMEYDGTPFQKKDEEWVYKEGKQAIVLRDGVFKANGKRYVSVEWEGHNEGFAWPCENLEKVFRAIEAAFKRMDEAEPEKPVSVEIRGICDDAFCPKCGRAFWDHEADTERCPDCGCLLNWERWHRLNDD